MSPHEETCYQNYIDQSRQYQHMVYQLICCRWETLYKNTPKNEIRNHYLEVHFRTKCAGHSIIVRLWTPLNYVHVCSRFTLYGKPIGQWQFEMCHDFEWRAGIENVLRNYEWEIDGFDMDIFKTGEMTKEMQELFLKIRRNAESAFRGCEKEPV